MKIISYDKSKDIIIRNMENTNSLSEVFISIVLESYQEGFKEGLNSAIEDLEKLKEEVANLCYVMYSNDGKNMVDITKNDIIYRINNRIEKLKGENK